jgi:hypothetical protein
MISISHYIPYISIFLVGYIIFSPPIYLETSPSPENHWPSLYINPPSSSALDVARTAKATPLTMDFVAENEGFHAKQ